MEKFIFNYSEIEETFDDLLRRASESKYIGKLKVANHLIMIPFSMEKKDGSHENGYHISIFRESWDGQIEMRGVVIGNHSLHVTDELVDKGEDGRSVYYKVVPFLRSISTQRFARSNQNSPSSTLSVPERLWEPESDVEYILHQFLGVKWRLEEVSI
jgi:hypothetical protein